MGEEPEEIVKKETQAQGPPPPLNKSEVVAASPVTTETKVRSASKTLKLTDLLKTSPKAEEKQAESGPEKKLNEPFTEEQLRNAWNEFASQRKKLQAEFQMLSQPYELRDKQIIVNLLSPVHETMLHNIKSELTGFLREKLKNNSIQVSGELTSTDDRRVMYTNREKFDYLAEKNPILKELKDRLGLDTDF